MYNVTSGAFVQPLLQWKSNKYYISSMQCACAILSSVACCIFPRCLINSTVLENKFIGYKMCLDFLYNFCLEPFSF